MIIWKGYGFIVFIIVFVNSLIAELISEEVSKNDHYYQENPIPMGISFFISGLMIFKINEYFDKKRSMNEGTHIFDKITITQNDHSLFFIPFKYWTYILVAISFILIIAKLLR